MRGRSSVLTYPQVGNYGVNADDAQAERPALRALVVRDLCPTPSSWRSQESLGDYLAREGVVAIEGIDTRALVRHIRDHGAQRAVVSTTDADVASLLEKVRRSPSLVGVNLAADRVLRRRATPAPPRTCPLPMASPWPPRPSPASRWSSTTAA